MERRTITHQGKVIFERVKLPDRFKRFPKVFQESEACFMYMNTGSFKFRTPTNLFELSEGEAIVAKCGNYYIEQLNPKEGHNSISIIGAYFYPKMVKEFFQTDLKLIDFQRNYDVSRPKMEPLIKDFISSINYLIDHRELHDDNLKTNKLKELLILLSKSDKSIQDYINGLFTPYEYDFNEIINNNLYANLSLIELSNLCGCSLATFKRRFDKFYSQSPAKYFLQKKLEKTYQLLTIDTLPIGDIAYDCGFENVPSFNKAFKKKYGCTPSQLRMSQKDNNLSF